MVVRSSVLALLFAAAACRGGADEAPAPPSPPPTDQTFEEGMRIACDAPDQAELPPEDSGESNRALVLAAWLDRRVLNREVRQLMGGGDAQTPEGKLAALHAGARRAGIERCVLAEMWQPRAASPAGSAATPVPSEPQTYDEAIALVCGAVAGAADDEALVSVVREQITNPEVAALGGALGEASLAERTRLLRDAAAKSGVTSCPLADRWAERQAAEKPASGG